MLQYCIKILLTAMIVVCVSEISKRSTLLGAFLVSLPLTSILAMVWIYAETKDAGKIAVFSSEVLWLVIPSLILFIALPVLLRNQIGFYLSMFISCLLTAAGYSLTILIRSKLG